MKAFKPAHLPPSYINPGDLGERRAAVELVEKCLQLISRPFRDDLDATVTQVLGVPAQPGVAGQTANKIAKVDPLHGSGDERGEAGVGRFGHKAMLTHQAVRKV